MYAHVPHVHVDVREQLCKVVFPSSCNVCHVMHSLEDESQWDEYIHGHIHTYNNTYTNTHTQGHIHVRGHIYEHMHIHGHMHIDGHIHRHIHVFTQQNPTWELRTQCSLGPRGWVPQQFEQFHHACLTEAWPDTQRCSVHRVGLSQSGTEATRP